MIDEKDKNYELCRLTQDSNKGISLITYNYLNLPETVQMKNGNSIHYTYDALGRKRGKSIVTLKSVVDVPMGQLHSALADEIKSNRKVYYCSNLEYAGLTKIRLYMQHIPDGYILSADLVFQITDHLGNVCAETGSGGHEIATYYPSGIRVDNSGTYLNSDYAFANKEFQSSHRLNLYDFGERYYEMHLSHWTTMDPLCEKYYWLSPYSYCGGNPVNRIDINGEWVYVLHDDQNYKYDDGNFYLKNEAQEWQTVDVSNNSFLSFIQETLKELYNGGEAGKGLINYFSNDDKNVYIALGESNSSRGAKVFINPESSNAIPTTDGMKRSIPFVSLGHEMTHVKDLYERGKDIYKTWLTLPNGKEITESEKQATHIENLIRNENGLPLRTHYVVGSNNKPYKPSTVVVGPGYSRFFTTKEKVKGYWFNRPYLY